MAADIPTIEPTKLQAGTTLKFQRSFPDFPASEWTLTYYLTSSTEAPLSFAATDEDGDHLVNVAYTTTEAWTPGDYLMTGFVDSGTERYQVYSQPLCITPNTTTQEPLEWKSDVRLIVEAMEQAALQQAGSAVVSYSINGRTFTRQPWDEFIRQLGYWRGRLATEETGGVMRRILIRRVGPR